MLEIKYSSEEQAIEMSMLDKPTIWPKLIRVLHDFSSEIEITSGASLQLPVWVFLAARNHLLYVLQKYQLEFSVDDLTTDILKRAKQNENNFHQAKNLQSIIPSVLIEKLKKAGFRRALTDEQIRNVSKLVALPAGATFSVPGAGKTTEALAFYYFKASEDSKLLVVSPKNAFSAWEEQIAECVEFSPHVTRLTGGRIKIKNALEMEPEVMLITYQQLSNVKSMVAGHLSRFPFFMFLDESHRIKRGTRGVHGSTILDLAHLPKTKLIMSGTPLPYSTNDLVPQFNFLYPEINIESESEIINKIRHVFVRTTKSELGLPFPKRKFVSVDMNPKQRHLYELMRSEEQRQLSHLKANERNRLRAFGKSVIRLLQMTSNPALLVKNHIDYPRELYDVLEEGGSPKMEYACYKARKLAQEGKKTLIWSNFVENVELIATRLCDLGAEFIHGGVEAGSDEESDTREFKIKKFHDDNQTFVLVANPAACAEGISLHTVCHHAIYVDRNYNAAQYLQSEDRIHRLGLPKDVTTTIEVIYCPDSVDESVHRRLSSKVERMAMVLDDQSLNIEPVETDLDEDRLDAEDISDFLKHLNRQ